MPIITKSHDTVVVDLQGQAYIRRADGLLQPLKVGDKVMRGDLILTSQDGIVELAQPTPEQLLAMDPPAAGRRPAAVADPLDRVIEGLANADPSVVPAAGGPANDGSGTPALRVERISEGTDPAITRSTGIGAGLDGNRVGAAAAAAELPTLNVGDLSASEEAGFIEFVIALSSTATQNVSVSYQVLGDSATAGVDFTPVSGTVTIVAGSNTAVVRVPVTSDTVFEGPETLVISLSNPVNASVGDGVAVATLVDNDLEPSVSSVGNPSVTEGADLVFSVVLSNASSTATSLPFAIAGGSASANDIGTPRFTNGVTFDPATGTLTVPAGVTQFNVIVPTVNDTRTEGAETVGILVGGRPGTGSLADNDAPPTGTNATLTLPEDGSRAFTPADFGFTATDGDTLAAVRIDTLPAAGVLTLGGVPVTAGQLIPAGSLGNLVFTPAPNANGAAYAGFTFSVQDSSGDFDPSPNTITFNVTPVADPAVLGGVTSGTTVEDTTLTASGQLTITDPDAGQAVFVAQTNIAGAHGSFSVNAAGAWVYTLNNADPAVQALGAGQSLPSETFTVTSADGSTITVTVAINGSNDGPVAAAAAVSATEGAAVVTGSVSATDADANAVLTFALNGAAPAGLSFNPNGSYSFNPANPAYNSLAVGQTLTISVPYTVTDDQGATSSATLTITVVGTNDAAIVGGVATGTVTEDGTVSASGALTVTDVDGPASFVPRTVAGTYGDFSIAANGQWTYTLRNGAANVQALTSADKPVESFTVTTADGTTSTVSVTVNGVNEAPIATVTPAAGAEDSAGIPITLQGGDVDGAVVSFTVGTLPANGTLLFNGVPVTAGQVIPASGNAAALSFVPNANWNGSTSFSFVATDGEGAASTPVTQGITVAAVNDNPVANPDLSATPINTPLNNIPVLANDTDVDGDPLTVTGAALANPALGTVTVNPNGTLNFSPATNVTGLVVITYTVSDGAGGTTTGTLTINVGANTPPNGSNDTVTLPEDGAHTFSVGSFGFTDADLGQTLAAVRIDTLPTAGTLTLNGAAVVAGQVVSASALANLVFTPAPNANGTGYASFTFSVQDNAGGFDPSPNTITFNVTPVADPAILGGDITGTTVEDSTLTANGQLTITDPDAGQAVFVAQTNVAGAHGSFSVNAAGAWVYTLNNADPAVQALGAGQSLPSETFTVTSADGTTITVTVAINGTNDGPVASDASASATEGAAAINGQLVATDVDANAVLSFALNGAAPAGLTLNPNGSYSFNPADPAYNSLAQGQVLTLSVPYTVTDDQGATSTAVLTITVVGTNDAAVVGGVATGTVTEDGTVLSSGTLTVSDVDSPATFQATTVSGTYGDFSLAANGQWTYTLRNGDATVQALTSTQTATESFLVYTADGTISNVTVTINGANEAPTVSVTPASGAEDSTGIPITLQGADVDGTVASFTVGSLPANGTLFYNGVAVTVGQVIPASANAAALSFVPNANWNGSTSFNFTATDNEGAASPQATQGITVTAVNDAPVALGGMVAGTEDTALVLGWTAFGVSDVDSSTLSVQITTLPADGQLQFFNGSAWVAVSANQTVTAVDITAGRLRFVPDANESGDGSFAGNGVGNQQADYARFNFRPFDGTDFGAPATVRIDIAPVADAPTISRGALPASVGLTLEYFDDVATVDTTVALNTAAVEAAVEALPPTSSNVVTNPNLANIGQDDAYRISGFIYLEAGRTYTVGGNRDDTFRFEIGGTTVFSQGFNNWGAFTAAGFTPTTSGYYSLEAIIYNGSGPGTLSLTLSVDGAPALPLTTANFSLYPTAAALAADTGAVGTFVPNGDGGFYPRQMSGPEDTAIRLDTLSITRSDNDGSETLAVTAAGLQVGSVLTDGTNSFTATATSTSASLLGWNLANLRYTPPKDFNGDVTLSVTATTTEPNGNTANAVISLPIRVLPVNDAPVANADTGAVLAGGTVAVTSANGVIQNPAGRDTDVEGDTLQVLRAGAGTGAPGTAVLGTGTTLVGTYGDLTLFPDGRYTYTANKASTVPTGTQVADVFRYEVSDGNGGTAVTSLTLNVGGQADVLNAPSPTVSPLAHQGLVGEYYGYNDFNPTGTNANRRHSDDGTVGNLDSIADVTTLINGRNAVSGGAAVVGTGAAAAASATDAQFTVRAINYGFTPEVNGSLGSTTVNVVAGGSVAGLTATNNQLFAFLNGNGRADGSTLVVNAGTADNDALGAGPTTGLGATSDAILRLTGFMQTQAGSYTIRVTADDGFQLRIGGTTVAEFNGNQSPTARTFTNVNLQDGIQSLELLYWEQGGNARLRVEIKASNEPDTSYRVLGSDALPIMATNPGLSDLQDIVNTGTPTAPVWQVRTGSGLDGSTGNDQLNGGDGRDRLSGGADDDILRGGAGRDNLLGGDGNDILVGGSGNDALSGGLGSDVFRWELADRGTAGQPARDVISDFDARSAANGGDVLDLRDLLQGETTTNLANYLDFQYDSTTGNTIVRISSNGGFASGNYSAAAEDQRITLQGIDLRSALGLGTGATDDQILQELLNRNKLGIGP